MATPFVGNWVDGLIYYPVDINYPCCVSLPLWMRDDHNAVYCTNNRLATYLGKVEPKTRHHAHKNCVLVLDAVKTIFLFFSPIIDTCWDKISFLFFVVFRAINIFSVAIIISWRWKKNSFPIDCTLDEGRATDNPKRCKRKVPDEGVQSLEQNLEC